MKIVIDARFLGTGTGIGRYVEQLILNLEKIDLENEYFILINQANKEKYRPARSNFKKIIVDIPWYGLMEQIKIPLVLKKIKPDLVHFPHFNVPFFYNQPFVVSIHDLILTKYPSPRATTLSPIKYFFKNLFYRIIINHAVQKSQVVITMANFTRNEIINEFHLGETQKQKIRVIYEGVTKLKENCVDVNLWDHACLFGRQGINQKFVLYLGNAYPHKNLEFLIKAWQNFKKDYQLVLIGKKDYFYQNLEKKIKELGLEKKVILTGFVPDEKLGVFYQQAQAYVFPSLCEGFGLPPLEALNFKLPVLVSNNSCLPEILQDSALYFNPQKEDDFLEKLNSILFNDDLREDLISNSEKILSKYSWFKMARKIKDLYLEFR
ncbi:glycosyltransferase family 4 protein [bacterium]|nr:glycosyltransferase family 4 protein [bacterium]